MNPKWLTVTRGTAPLIVSIPHAGTDIPDGIAERLVSLPLARHDADLYVDRLYDFAAGMGATVVATAILRTVIDVNRDPMGASLYPGQATTELCPTTTFDGAPLYRSGSEPDAAEIARRREIWFQPYHDALAAEIDRLRARHDHIVLYEAHSIRSFVPRLFEGALPQFNIGTNSGASCDPVLTAAVEKACTEYPREGGGPDVPYPERGNSGPPPSRGYSVVVDGRFKGGWTTRHYGAPDKGVHAIQMELAMRGYLEEDQDWPPPWDAARAATMQPILQRVLEACLRFANLR